MAEKKYKTIGELNEAWHVYSYRDFEDVVPPWKFGFFPDSVDWLTFRHQRTYENIQWKIDRIRQQDSDTRITAHGMNGCFEYYSQQCSDHWAAAEKMDIYGITWVPCRKGNEPWRHFAVFDLMRSASGHTPFWHTEAQGGPLWLQPQLKGRARSDGRVPEAEDIRLWNLMGMACGCRGILYTRFRPLLDGPLFGSFAPYGMDGGRTSRSQMVSKMARWANIQEQEELWTASPKENQVDILFLPESERASFLLTYSGNENRYPDMMYGAYQGFFCQNIQTGFTVVENLKKKGMVYMPFPVSLSEEHAGMLREWVKEGGTLISESCPGYFSEALHAQEEQPGMGMAELFGSQEEEVEFMPDLFGTQSFCFMGESVRAGGFAQYYREDGGRAVAWHDGKIIGVENRIGEGRTLLIGANPSLAGEENRGFFKKLLEYLGVSPRVSVSESGLTVRFHVYGDRQWIWIINGDRETKKALITIQEDERKFQVGRIYWQGGSLNQDGDGRLRVSVEGRNGLVAELLTRREEGMG